MPEDKSKSAPADENAPIQPLTLEQENNVMLKEILRNVRWTRRVHTASLIISIAFIVLPVIAATLILPKLISSMIGIYGEYGKDVGITPSGNIFDLLKELQNAQQSTNSNTNTQ